MRACCIVLAVAIASCGGGRSAPAPRSDAAELPGAALRRLGGAHARGKLAARDRRRFGELVRARARARLALGDRDAYRDFELAWSVGARSTPRERTDAYFLGAVIGLRRGDLADLRLARSLIERARRLSPDDDRLAIAAPEKAAVGELGAAAAWAHERGAKRLALELYEQYLARDGRQREHLLRWVEVHRWWYGMTHRPDRLLLREVEAAGIDLCAFARTPDELDCERAIQHLVDAPEAGEAVRRHAASQAFVIRDAGAASAWTAIALRAWLAGDVDSWLGELTRRVDVARVDIAKVALYSRPTILRAMGRRDEARAALNEAMEAIGTSSPEARSVVAAELMMTTRGPHDDVRLDRAEQLLGAERSNTAWLLTLRAAAAMLDPAREAAVLDRAPAALVREHLRDTGELGALVARFGDELGPFERHALDRWWHALDVDTLRRARDRRAATWRTLGGGDLAIAPATDLALAPGIPDPARLAGELGGQESLAGLLAIAREYPGNPARADRLAVELVDGGAAVGERGPVVAELFARLGDLDRAADWHARVLASSPNNPDYLIALARAEAMRRRFDRAEALFVHGGGLSGDAGAVSLAAAKIYLDRDAYLYAITAGKRAVSLTGRGLEGEALAVVAAAQLGLRRQHDAASALQAYVDRVAPPQRDAARAEAIALWGDRPLPDELRGKVWRGTRGEALAHGGAAAKRQLAIDPADAAIALAAGDDTAIARALAWNPQDVSSRRAAFARAAPGSERQRDLVAELLAIGLIAPAHRAAPALEAAADALAACGVRSLAEAIRREARALRAR